MGKQRKTRSLPSSQGRDMYWQSADYNGNVMRMFTNQIMRLALMRYEWVNLPESCNERYLETILLRNGMATISFPKRMPGVFLSLMVGGEYPPNMYNEPKKWSALGDNGTNFECDNRNGVVVFENRLRAPLLWDIQMWAQELADIYRTMQINRLHQKTPYIIKGSQSNVLDMQNLYKQIGGGEPAILALNGIEQVQVDVLSTGVPYLGSDLQAAYESCWNNIFKWLGIEHLPFKAERRIEDEVRSMSQPTVLTISDGLECRREAADKLNRRFGNLLKGRIEVVVRHTDSTSENQEFVRSLPALLETLDGGANDGGDAFEPGSGRMD